VITIVIPTYQEEKLLPALLAQLDAELLRRHNAEVVISDGGSTDKTLAIAEAYGALIVRHEGEHKQTIAEGRNQGASVANGDMLLFINADIRISDVDIFLSSVNDELAKPGVVGVTASVHVFPEEERFSDRVFHLWHNGYVRFLNIIGEGMGRGECQAMLRATFERIGGYNASMVAGEDYDLFRRARKTGRIVMLKGVTVFESPRRFREYGYLHILWGWSKNALAVIFRNSSSSDEWKAVR